MNACASAAMLMASLLLAGAAHAQPIELDGIGLSRDVPCAGQDVNITGNANRIHLTGDCGAVEVYGSEHEVSLESATALAVLGVGHVVEADTVGRLTVATSGNRVHTAIAAAGEQPAAVEVTGAEHELELRFTGPVQVSVDGADTRLRWSGDDPTLSSSGSGHQIERRP